MGGSPPSGTCVDMGVQDKLVPLKRCTIPCTARRGRPHSGMLHTYICILILVRLLPCCVADAELHGLAESGEQHLCVLLAIHWDTAHPCAAGHILGVSGSATVGGVGGGLL